MEVKVFDPPIDRLLNNMSFQDISSPTWKLSPNANSGDLVAFNAVASGDNPAYTEAITLSGSWDGGVFRTYVSTTFSV